ncbi:MAG: hypothetical protein QOE70_5670 [Chthoniobacter sp.]|jgi:hypothetical protein|nr:hypothetical protein [Chthoniobacter sp.]
MTSQEFHDEKLREVAENYRDQGYEVVLAPPASSIPNFDKALLPDLLATKDGNHIVVEIKGRSALRHSDTVRRMADALAGNPDWRFELVVFEEDESLLMSEGSDTMSVQVIAKQLAAGDLLLRQQELPAALILTWIALEAALRRLAGSRGVPLGSVAPVMMIKELTFAGLLDREEHDFLTELLPARNRIVHGFTAPHLTEGVIVRLRSIVNDLLSSSERQTAAA